MKYIYKSSLVFLLALITFSCGDDLVEKVVVDESAIVGGTIASLPMASFELTYANANTDFETISWEETDYGFATSVSYTVQVAPASDNFQNPVTMATTTELSGTFSIGDLNGVLFENFELEVGVPIDIQIRVMSELANTAFAPVFSAPIDIAITLYDTNIPPIYLLGSVQDWTFANAAVLASVAPLQYLGFAQFETGATFRLFEQNAFDVGDQWGFSFFTNVPEEFGNTGDGDSNFIFNGTESGLYSVAVDLNAKSIVIEAQLFPTTMLIMGNDQGWDMDNEPMWLRHIGGGVFEGVETFNSENSLWRFFETQAWGAKQHDYNTFLDGTIPNELSGVTEGDANFSFNGTSGVYKITADFVNLVIEMEPVDEPTMIIMGGDQGWSFTDGTPYYMTWVRGEKFTGTTGFTAGTEWRFFPSFDVWGFARNYNDFESVDPAFFTGPNGGDANFLNAQAGTFTITIDVVPGTFIVNRIVEE